MKKLRTGQWLAVATMMGAAGCSFPTSEFNLGPQDTGVAVDVGARDTGAPVDTGAADTGVVDAGQADTGAVDTGTVVDAMPADLGADAGPAEDATVADATSLDAGGDAGASDAGPADVGLDVTDTGNIVFCATARPCPTGLVCDDGICQASCPSGQSNCGGFCRAVQTDTSHCGMCGNACQPGQDCTMGACRTVCAAPTTNCNNVCRDLQADNNNCGACGTVCMGGTSCASGRCTCPTGQNACSGTCTNLQTDLANCGACGTRCASGQLCSNGMCVTTCAAGLTNCSGTCRNLQSDVAACGSCTTRCTPPTGGTATCANGACVLTCPTGRTNCNGVCVDRNSDEANCGTCGNVCLRGLAICDTGLCCTRGTTNCSGRCVSLQSDEANCGACGRVCTSGFTCRLGACEPNFRVGTMTANNCRAIDQMAVGGDDRGGIAVNVSYVFYTGDQGVARANAFDLSSPTQIVAGNQDGLVNNLRTGTIYGLSSNGTSQLQAVYNTTGNLTHLLELNLATLAPTGTRIALNPPIPFDFMTLYGRYGVFSGFDRVVIYNGTRAFNISLPSGAVTDLGTVQLATPFTCENWAFWGVAEFHGDALWLVYRQAPSSGTASNVVRVRVPDGLTQAVGSFTNLSDMCSFTVSTARNRWYWHHEGLSQFYPSTVTGGTAEVLGYCDATFTFTN
ncbi:MAG: hypothetical protein JNK72_16205 [Myxococcales bacterium]|nr:hypothetical protein [Myxococcales bacterium]